MSGDSNIAIGNDSGVETAALRDTIAIGNNVRCTANYQIVIGNNALGYHGLGPSPVPLISTITLGDDTNTLVVPGVSGADLGTTTRPWGDVYCADKLRLYTNSVGLTSVDGTTL